MNLNNNPKKEIKIKLPSFVQDDQLDESLVAELNKITYEQLTTSSTARTIKNIKKNLTAALKTRYNIKDKARLAEVTEHILKLHGLSALTTMPIRMKK